MTKPLACLLAASLTVCAAQLPRKAPDFQMQLPSGKTVSLNDYKGKAVALAFILTTCSHCQYTTGLLVKLQNEFAFRGLQVLECAVNNGADHLVAAFTQQYKTNFPVGYNYDQDLVLGFMQHPPDKVPSMPMLSFIDRRGMIRAQFEGEDPFIASPNQEQNIRGEILKLLGAPAAAQKSH